MPEEKINARLETFCDGVFAIALTLLVLELRAPLAINIHGPGELWESLKELLPAIYAFLLSFGIILISWVNHHYIMKLFNRSSPQFIYANGFLLLTIVIIPFPTALLSEFGFSDAAAPAVVIYSFVNWLTNIGWLLVARTGLHPDALTKNENSRQIVEKIKVRGYYAFFIYLACTIIAFWFPTAIAIALTLIWISWMIFGLRSMHVYDAE